MPVRKKGEAYHHGDLRRAVIDAALGVIARAGPDGLSLRDLARRLGVSHQAPYRHFADKPALLAAIAAEGFSRLVERLRAGPPIDATDPCGALIESGMTYVGFAVREPAYYRVMFTVATTSHGSAAAGAQPGSALDILTGVVARGQAAGALPAVHVAELALLCWSVAHGLAMLAIDGKLGPRAAALGTARAALTLQVRTLEVAARSARR